MLAKHYNLTVLLNGVMSNFLKAPKWLPEGITYLVPETEETTNLHPNTDP